MAALLVIVVLFSKFFTHKNAEHTPSLQAVSHLDLIKNDHKNHSFIKEETEHSNKIIPPETLTEINSHHVDECRNKFPLTESLAMNPDNCGFETESNVEKSISIGKFIPVEPEIKEGVAEPYNKTSHVEALDYKFDDGISGMNEDISQEERENLEKFISVEEQPNDSGENITFEIGEFILVE